MAGVRRTDAARALRPLAQARPHPECFWRGWRLIAADSAKGSRKTVELLRRPRWLALALGDDLLPTN